MGLQLAEGPKTPTFKRGNQESRIDLDFKSTVVSCSQPTTEWIQNDYSALLMKIKLQHNLPPRMTKMAVDKVGLEAHLKEVGKRKEK